MFQVAVTFFGKAGDEEIAISGPFSSRQSAESFANQMAGTGNVKSVEISEYMA